MAKPHSENPFLHPHTSEDPFAGDTRADAGEDVGYALVKSAPEVDASECEIAGTSVLEVMVLWGTTVLHVAHLTPARAFHVGESTPAAACDFELPAAKLGA